PAEAGPGGEGADDDTGGGAATRITATARIRSTTPHLFLRAPSPLPSSWRAASQRARFGQGLLRFALQPARLVDMRQIGVDARDVFLDARRVLEVAWRLLQLSFAQERLSQRDVRAEVPRILLQHSLELGDRLLPLLEHQVNQPQSQTRLHRGWFYLR